MRFFLPNQVGVRDGINGHCLLEQAIEEFPTVARLAPVETEGKFVQVVHQVLPGHPPLVDAQEPPFQQGSDAVDSRQQGRGCLSAGTHHAGPVDVSELGQSGIGRPAVRDDHEKGDVGSKALSSIS